MTDHPRSGIVGAGFIGEVHARAVRGAGGVVAAVAGSNPRSSAAAASRLRADRAASSADELVDAEDVDVEWAERHEADAQLRAGGQHLRLGVAGPQRVLALHRGHRVHCVRAADRVRGGFGEAEVADLAGRDELGDSPGNVLDRDVRVDAVLVEQVDRVDPQPAQRRVGDPRDLLRAASSPTDRPSSMRQPNFVAITT
jgi:threonine dehydrogenase-like Zn-dependent dehydrogenase